MTTSAGVFKSTDRGATWSAVTSGNYSALAISPAYASDQTLFAGYFGVNVFKSTTGGSNWGASSSDFLTKHQLTSLSVSPSYGTDHTAFTVVSLAAPMMSVTPSVLSFAPVDPNSSSLPKQVTIKNGMAGLMGTGNLAITGMTLSGAGAGDFSSGPRLVRQPETHHSRRRQRRKSVQLRGDLHPHIPRQQERHFDD